MSAEAIRMCELEERLAGPESAQLLEQIAAQLVAVAGRLNGCRSTPLPVDEFRKLEAALLAVAAASEVISALRPLGVQRQADPLRDPPGQIRRLQP